MGVITDYLSCTQAATTYARNNAGVLTAFSPNTLRRTDRGLLVEGARTNHCVESVTLGVINGVSSWLRNNTTIISDDAEAPDGTMTATRVTDTAASGAHNLSHIMYGSITGQGVASIWAKAGTMSCLNITWSGTTVLFNLATGRWRNWGLTNNTAGAFHNAYIEEFADGWWRCSISVTSNGGLVSYGLAPNDAFRIPGGGLSLVSSYLGDGTGTMWMWGSQVEEGAHPSSYIKTPVKATVTRAADVVSFTGAANTLLNVASNVANGRSIVVEVLLPDGSSAMKVINGSGGAPLFIGQSGLEHRKGVTTVSGSAISGTSLIGADVTTGMKFGMSWGAGGRSIVAGQGTVGTSGHEAFGAGTVYVGDGTLFGYIKSIKLWDERLPDAVLKSHTSFSQSAVSTEEAPEDFYFGIASDRNNMLSPHSLVWEVGPANLYNYNNAYYKATWTVNRAVGSSLPDNWIPGPGPRFYYVSVEAATVSIGAAAAAPDESTNARKIVESSGLSEHYVHAGVFGSNRLNITDGIRLKYSVFLKAGERTRAQLVVSDVEYISSTRGGFQGIRATFDLAAGTVVRSGGFGEWTTGSLIGAEITPWGDGWYRCTLKWRYLYMGAGDIPTVHVRAGVILDAGWGNSPDKTYYKGDGSSGLYMWRANVNTMAADIQITHQLLMEHFDDPNTVDVYNTRMPGFNMYCHETWPVLADAYYYDDTIPQHPESHIIENSTYRAYRPAGMEADYQAVLRTIVWAGNSVDAYATGEGLANPSMTWDEVRAFLVGKAYRPPAVYEVNIRWPYPEAWPTQGLWCHDVRAFMSPWLNVDGTPQQLRWPTAEPNHTELNIRENGFGQQQHVWITNQTTGVQTQEPQAQMIVPEIIMPTNDVPRTYTYQYTITTADDIAFCLAFIDGILYGGWDCKSFPRSFNNDRWCDVILYVASDAVCDWVAIHGNPAISVSEGLATGPL